MDYDETARLHMRLGVLDEDAFVETVVGEWVREYRRATRGEREIVEVGAATGFTYIYDATPHPPLTEADNRVLGAWGRSRAPSKPRDASRMRGYPSPQREDSERLDRGHLIAHAIGGEYDMNLVPQDAALNRGTGEGDKRWRELERYCAAHPGTLVFVRALYSDNSDRPAELEYGIVEESGDIHVVVFSNINAANPEVGRTSG